jgi:polyisoprenoid-binding protein YceI/predicted dinucleotide-binding enzyme
MNFGMIGAGTLSRAIAGHVIQGGHDVMFSNSRGPETLGDVVDAFGPHASAGTVAEAGAADFVVLTVNWERVHEALSGLPYRKGRILIDATNQWLELPPAFIVDRLEVGGSEWVASLVPGAHVIKAFDNLYAPTLADDPITDAGRRILFYAGDDQDSKERFRAVVEGFGFAPIDLGPLRMGRLMQVDGPLTGVHAIRQAVPHPVPMPSNKATAPAELAAGTWTIDPAHSSISFSVRHLMISRVRGTLGTFSGDITVPGQGTPSVAAEIVVGSVATGNDDRDAHLKSARFFDVERYPTATFTSTCVRVGRGGAGYALEGDFTLKGITRPISLGLEFNGISPGMGHGAVAGFQASVVLNRKDFGIDIDLPLETGGVVVGDRVTVTLEIEATRTD